MYCFSSASEAGRSPLLATMNFRNAALIFPPNDCLAESRAYDMASRLSASVSRLNLAAMPNQLLSLTYFNSWIFFSGICSNNCLSRFVFSLSASDTGGRWMGFGGILPGEDDPLEKV